MEAAGYDDKLRDLAGRWQVSAAQPSERWLGFIKLFGLPLKTQAQIQLLTGGGADATSPPSILPPRLVPPSIEGSS